MTQLNTLKDIPIEAGVYPEYKIDQIEPDLKICFRWKELIRQEAIKWIRELQKIKCTYNHEYSPWEESHLCLPRPDMCTEELSAKGKIEFIKHFFNITEEDLK